MNLTTSNPQKRILIGLVFSALMLSSFLYAQDWHTVTPPGAPSSRQGHSMVTLPDGKVLLLGGEDHQGTLFNDIYAFADNDWEKLIPTDNQLPPTSGHSMTAMPDDNIYFVFGGKTADGYSNDIYEFNQNTNDFIKREPQGDKPPGRANHNAFENEGDLWIFGGRNETGPLSDCWVYSSTQNEWIRDADAPHPIEKSCMWKKGDALVFYRAGGTQIFNLETSSWSTAGTNTEYRTAVTSVQIGNHIYFIGGNVTDEGMAKTLADTLYSNETVVLNTETSLLDTAASLPYGIANAAAASFLDPDDNKEKILLFGGRISDGSLNTQTFVYTPEDETSVEDNLIPGDFRLLQNYPNPFNPTTVICYCVKKACMVTLKVLDVRGREIQTLKDSYQAAGYYQVEFTSENLPSGLYFYKMEMDGFQSIKKMVKVQ